jgi:hypothetical protein
MKTFLVGAVAAVGLTLGMAATEASAYWVTRVVQQWDPFLGTFVTVQQRVWVPDPVFVPAPVVVPRPVVVPAPSFRSGPGIPRPIPTIGGGFYLTRPVSPGWVGFGVSF